jgi:crotonobetainyl-CoA:carnitine CoA-transferase CaiB-like acyl-CoA transferase
MLLAISVVGALYRRKGTGEGERLELAMQDALADGEATKRVAAGNKAMDEEPNLAWRS